MPTAARLSQVGCRRPDHPSLPHLLPELQEHVGTYVPADCPYVFPNSKGEPLSAARSEASGFERERRAGLPKLPFHDLRHTGNTLAAATGASTRELMARMGHSSMRAALIYQHATKDREAAIAAALSELAGRSAPRESAPVVTLRGAGTG
jgi:integrase